MVVREQEQEAPVVVEAPPPGEEEEEAEEAAAAVPAPPAQPETVEVAVPREVLPQLSVPVVSRPKKKPEPSPTEGAARRPGVSALSGGASMPNAWFAASSG